MWSSKTNEAVLWSNKLKKLLSTSWILKGDCGKHSQENDCGKFKKRNSRLDQKSAISEFFSSKSKKTGKMFTINVVDNSGKLQVVAFDKECDTLYNQFKTGETYSLEKAAVKVNPYRTVNYLSNYQIVLSKFSKVTLISIICIYVILLFNFSGYTSRKQPRTKQNSTSSSPTTYSSAKFKIFPMPQSSAMKVTKPTSLH